jgi:SNF2 family DNA or RNA helicase
MSVILMHITITHRYFKNLFLNRRGAARVMAAQEVASLLERLLLRRTKKDIFQEDSQMKIPPKTMIIVKRPFSNDVEKQMYDEYSGRIWSYIQNSNKVIFMISL